MRFSCFIGVVMILSVLMVRMDVASADAGPPTQLKLNNLIWTHHSSGIRSYNLVDAYQCVLYIPTQHKLRNDKLNKEQRIASIKSLEHPVALRIEILTSMLPDTMPEVWHETIESEVTGKAFHRFQEGFAGLDEGDILLFVYMPGESTRLFLNDKLVFKDPGSGLIQGLLEQWIGSHPVSEDLKQALLGE